MRLKSKINKIIDAIKDTDITEIEISSFWGAQKIRLKKGGDTDITCQSNLSHSTNEQMIDNPVINVPSPKVENNVVADINSNDTQTIDEDNFTVIKAPLVGTFYLSPKPGEPQYVNVGDKISAGSILCIVEAMKIFNEIESDVSGTVKEICLENGNPVEFDQCIIKVSID